MKFFTEIKTVSEASVAAGPRTNVEEMFNQDTYAGNPGEFDKSDPHAKPKLAPKKKNPNDGKFVQHGAKVPRGYTMTAHGRVVKEVAKDGQVDEGGQFSYGAKDPKKGSQRELSAKANKDAKSKSTPIEPKDQMVGIAKVTKVKEGLADDFMASIDKKKFPQARIVGNVDAQKKERDEMIAKRTADNANKPTPVKGPGDLAAGFGQNKGYGQGRYMGDSKINAASAVTEAGGEKNYGVRYKVFASKEGRLTTKEYWTTSSEKLERAATKIEELGNFHSIDGYSYPPEPQGMAEGDQSKSASASRAKEAHEQNLDAAHRELMQRDADGEDMSGYHVNPRTYKIQKQLPGKKWTQEEQRAHMIDRMRNEGLEEASVMTSGHKGYDAMLSIMKAAAAGRAATFTIGEEELTLDYNEATFLAGKYKAFLKAGRQEEFLKYMESPRLFDRLMSQLRTMIDKQKNFKGSVQGDRQVPGEKSSPFESVTEGHVGPTHKDWASAVQRVKQNKFKTSDLVNSVQSVPYKHLAQLARDSGLTPSDEMLKHENKSKVKNVAEGHCSPGDKVKIDNPSSIHHGKTATVVSHNKETDKTIVKHSGGKTMSVDHMYLEKIKATKKINELSPKTLGSYAKKASSSSDERSNSSLSSRAAYKLANDERNDDGDEDDHKSFMRSKGIAKAVDRLTKESPSLKEGQYFCLRDNVAKVIPTGYKLLESGFIARK